MTTIAGREAEIFVAGDSVVLVESTDPLKDTHCWLTPEAKWSPFPEQAVKFADVDAAQTFLYEHADKPAPPADVPSSGRAVSWLDNLTDAVKRHRDTPAEPPADAGKMVAVGEGRKWTQAIIDLAADIREVDGGHSLGAAELAEKLIERGWRATTAEIERLRGECESMASELAHMRTTDAVQDRAALLENCVALTATLTTLREQLAAAERERDQLKQADTATRHRLLSDPDLPKGKYASVTEMVADIAARERDDAELYLTEIGVPEFNEDGDALLLKDRIARLEAELAAAKAKSQPRYYVMESLGRHWLVRDVPSWDRSLLHEDGEWSNGGAYRAVSGLKYFDSKEAAEAEIARIQAAAASAKGGA